MRTVIVSGASSGIGQATAERFAAAGDRVVNLDVKPPADGGSAARWIKADVADWSAVRDAVAEVHAEHGRLDVVIANAGISVRHGVLEIEEADARRVIEVNLLGVLGLWRHAAELMTGQEGGGVLLATASVNGLRGYPFYADYNATKAGVIELTRSMALELAPRIRVCAVAPGYVLTPMQRAEYSDAMLAEVNMKIPMGRHASPEEIAGLFAYLASDDAGFATGHVFTLDGGETAGGLASR